jgi:hypothetical protein
MKTLLVIVAVVLGGCGVSAERWEACESACEGMRGLLYVHETWVWPDCDCRDGTQVKLN